MFLECCMNFFQEGFRMKRKGILFMVGMCAFLMCTGVAFGKSKVSGAVINKSKVKNSANIAVGEDSTANMGSTVIEDSDIKGAVINKSKVKNSANIAVGEDSTANMGSTVIEDSDIKGTVINKSKVKNSANIAVGEDSTANLGSVDIQ